MLLSEGVIYGFFAYSYYRIYDKFDHRFHIYNVSENTWSASESKIRNRASMSAVIPK